MIKKYIENFDEKDEKYECIAALNGEDGYQKYLFYKPQIIITDILMPKMNGMEFIEKVQENENAPVIWAITGNCNQDQLEVLIDNLDGNVLLKPFEMVDIEFILEKYEFSKI